MISIRLRGRRDELNTFTLIYSTCHIRRFLLSLFVCLLVLFSIIYFVGLRRYQSRTQVWYLRMKIFHYYLYFLQIIIKTITDNSSQLEFLPNEIHKDVFEHIDARKSFSRILPSQFSFPKSNSYENDDQNIFPPYTNYRVIIYRVEINLSHFYQCKLSIPKHEQLQQLTGNVMPYSKHIFVIFEYSRYQKACVFSLLGFSLIHFHVYILFILSIHHL